MTEELKLNDIQLEKAKILYNILQRKRVSLDASDTGSGKSFIALKLIKKFIKNNHYVIIICPLNMIPIWRNLIDKYIIDKTYIIDIINYDQLKINKTKYFNDGWLIKKDSLIVFDEAHKMKSFRSQVSKLITKLNKSKYYCHLMSATIADNPIFLSNIIVKLLKYYQNEFIYFSLYGIIKGYKNKGYVFNNDKSKLQLLHNIIFNNEDTRFGIRINKDNLIEYLPDENIKVFYINLDVKLINNIYKQYSS